jgi:nucleotide-binding universal stress UspA family protein
MRILLCTDGSAHGQAALRYGALLARASSEAATLLGVVEHAADRAQIERALKEGATWLGDAPQPRAKVRIGHAAEEILDEATPKEYDLVVVGARGRRGITRFLMGSTSERIARHAAVSVLIVRGEHLQIRRILVCTGGRKIGLDAVAFGGRVAKLVGAEVTVLHVMSQLAASTMLPEAGVLQAMPQTPAPPSTDELQLEDLEAPAEELMAHETSEGRHLQQALDILADQRVPGQALVRHGLIVEEISDEACDGKYDLIVVGAHPVEGWMRLLLNDVGKQIISCCPESPVLVARTKPS